MHGGSGGCLSFAKSLQKFLNDLNEAVAPCVTGKDGAVVQHVQGRAVHLGHLAACLGEDQAAGGAWYPESMVAWEKAQVLTEGSYVALVASAQFQTEAAELFTAKFA